MDSVSERGKYINQGERVRGMIKRKRKKRKRISKGREIKRGKDRERERVMEQRSDDYRIVGGDDDSAANSEGSISCTILLLYYTISYQR